MNMNSLPDDPSFDRRLAVLETRIDTILPTLATKSDIDRLRAEIFIGLSDNLKWSVGIMLTMLIAFLGVNFAMLNAMRSPTASYQASGPTAQPGAAVQLAPARPAQVK
jgi:hypothetical protein